VGHWAVSYGFQVHWYNFMVPVFWIWMLGQGFRISGFRWWVSDFGFQALGHNLLVYTFVLRVYSFLVKGANRWVDSIQV
jgi:hypothetical protein